MKQRECLKLTLRKELHVLIEWEKKQKHTSTET